LLTRNLSDALLPRRGRHALYRLWLWLAAAPVYLLARSGQALCLDAARVCVDLLLSARRSPLVTDGIDCSLRSADEEIDPVILSVGEDEEISIKDVATAIAKHVGYSGGLEVCSQPLTDVRPLGTPLTCITCADQFDSTKADGQHRKPASNAKLLKLINSKGGEPFRFTPFEEAMEESVKWFLDNYECVRPELEALADSCADPFSPPALPAGLLARATRPRPSSSSSLPHLSFLCWPIYSSSRSYCMTLQNCLPFSTRSQGQTGGGPAAVK
jgi:hypothetical protein